MKATAYGVKENVSERFTLPGDKSIAHRSLIIGSIPKGRYEVSGFPFNGDCLTTLACMRKLGVKIVENGDALMVESPGYEGFLKTPGILNGENSGTTVRLMSGLIASCGVKCQFTGDDSLKKRPMKRVIDPLKLMGAEIDSNDGFLPLEFRENKGLRGIEHVMTVNSAQVKSCILIAGLMSHGGTTVVEKVESRDHTERMMKYLGADMNVQGNRISLKNSEMTSKDMFVPGDVSSAAYLVAAALLADNAAIEIEKVLLNERRIQYLKLLKSMGADIRWKTEAVLNGEEVGTIWARSSKLTGMTVPEGLIPNIIDEIPILSVLGAFAKGKMVFQSVEELKYKESDRVASIVHNLEKCGIEAQYLDGDLTIKGDNDCISKDVVLDSFNDHRIAMSFLMLGLRNSGTTTVKDYQCAGISYPNSLEHFSKFISIETE